MDTVEKVLPSEVNLVRFGKTEMFLDETQTETKQTQPTEKRDGPYDMKLKCSEVLDLIVPAKEWEEDGKLYRQKLSDQPGSKKAVNNLNEKLDMYLERFNANEMGICPVKEQLHMQCFNELIRQVTVHCAERGNLLIRVRDDMKMNIDGYRNLYESLTAKGMRKALLMRKKKADLEKKVQRLMFDNEKLEAELAETTAKTQAIERDIVDARVEHTKHQVESLTQEKRKNELIKDQLKSAINGSKR